MKTEVTLDEADSLLRLLGQDRGRTDAAHGMFCRNVTRHPCVIGCKIATDQLDDHAIWVAQAQHWLAKLLHRTFGLHMIAQCPLQPEANRRTINGKRNFADLTMTDTAFRTIFPDEESDQRAGRARAITIEEVQLLGIFKAASLLDDTQAKKACIEIDIGLNLARNEREVMDAAGHDCDLPLLWRQVSQTEALTANVNLPER